MSLGLISTELSLRDLHSGDLAIWGQLCLPAFTSCYGVKNLPPFGFLPSVGLSSIPWESRKYV